MRNFVTDLVSLFLINAIFSKYYNFKNENKTGHDCCLNLKQNMILEFEQIKC